MRAAVLASLSVAVVIGLIVTGSAAAASSGVTPAGCGGFRAIHNITVGMKVHCVTRSFNRLNLHLNAILPPKGNNSGGIAELSVTAPRPGLLGYCNESFALPHAYSCHGIKGKILSGSVTGGWLVLTVTIR